MAAAVEAFLAEPWPGAFVPPGASTAPWADVVRVAAAARRLENWATSVQLRLAARLTAAWRAAPPVGNDLSEDRCEADDAALAERERERLAALPR